jgi:hypothetical protein
MWHLHMRREAKVVEVTLAEAVIIQEGRARHTRAVSIKIPGLATTIRNEANELSIS